MLAGEILCFKSMTLRKKASFSREADRLSQVLFSFGNFKNHLMHDGGTIRRK